MSIDTASSSGYAIAAVFSWGEVDALNYARYVRLNEPLEIDGETFAPAPELSVEAPEIDGGTKFKSWRVSARISRSPFDKLCRPYAHAPIDVDILEVDIRNPTDFRLWHRGRLMATERNKGESKRLVSAEVIGPKRRLDTPLGIPCTSGCIHTFGDRYCGYDVPAHDIEIESIDGHEITFSGYTPPRSTYFRNGELRVFGLRMTVIQQINDTTLRMERRPPPEWVGVTVSARPGCDKQANGDCLVFENRCRFLGLGIKMPTHNPLLESKE